MSLLEVVLSNLTHAVTLTGPAFFGNFVMILLYAFHYDGIDSFLSDFVLACDFCCV